MFPKNEGSFDRDIRLAVGLLLMIPAVFLLHGMVQIMVAVVSVVMITTAALGFCPLYSIIGIKTNKGEV
ncbi:MAG: DUF2892 domain-containing protein [Oscillochloris sp.]|nr:DUF2892 domain-containing protein [Oscillochloris sp.]